MNRFPKSTFTWHLIGIIGLIWLTPTWADESENANLTIEPQSLASALRQFSRQTGLQVGYASELADGLISPAVDGIVKEPALALETMLVDTGLEYRFVNDKTVMIRAAALTGNENAELGKHEPALTTLIAQAHTPEQQTQPGVANEVTSESQSHDEAVTDVEEVIVTATKREVNIQDLPQSISSLSGSLLESIGAESFRDFANLIPGLNVSKPSEAGQQSVNIRGIGPLGNGDSDFATVGFYIDETPISDASRLTDFALFDVERVEVLRGPQGTLFGEGSLGGTIRILSNKPNPDAFKAKAETTFSSIEKGGDSYRLMAMLNMPLVEDTLAARFVAGYIDTGGYVDNIRTGSKDVDGSETSYFRGAINFEASENLSILASVIYQSLDGRGAAFDQTGTPDLTQERAIDGDYEDDGLLASLIIDYEFDWAMLTSATSYFDRNTDRKLDLPPTTFAIADLFGIPGFLVPELLPSGTIEVDDTSTETFSQEIRLVSSNDGTFEWLVGGFYRQRDNFVSALVDQDELPILTGGFLSSDIFDIIHNSSYEHIALFSDATYHLSDRSHVSGGFRIFRETINSKAVMEIPILGTGVIPSTTHSKEEDVQLKAAYSYDFTEDAMGYFSFSEGFRPGGFNFRLLAPTVPPTFDSDTTRNYEIGSKTSWGDRNRGVTLNLAFYRTDWLNSQLADFTLGGANFTFNAGEVRIHGAELELSARPTDGLDLGLNFGYNKSELQEDIFSLVSGQQLASKGDPLPFAPEITYNVYAAYAFPLSTNFVGFGRVDFAYVDERNSDFGLVGAASTLPSYQILSLRAGITANHWSVTVFADNVTDERAILNVVDPITHGLLRNTPRSFGITLRAEY